MLNRAEAYAHTGNIVGALSDLQILIDRRYLEGDLTLTMERLRPFFGVPIDDGRFDQGIVLEYVVNFERRKEFFMQGLRWYDVKRYNFEITHVSPNGSNTLESDDLRRVFQIPTSAIEVGGLEPNPR